MLIIGVTGGSGSGKSVIAAELCKISGKCVDADRVYHELLDSCIAMRKDILDRFPEARTGESRVDTAVLARLVFSDSKALSDLNRITHPYVVRDIEHRIGEFYRCNCEMAVIDAPLLFESGINRMCDITVGIVAPRNIRIDRVTARDGIDFERAAARVDAQPKDAFYMTKCDVVLENDGSVPPEENAKKLYDKIMEGMDMPNE